jgi:selenium metabolism protein YedF
MGKNPRRAVLLVANDELGHGSSELGRILMRSFLKTVAGTEPKPERAIFMNAGVRLTTEGSKLLDEIRALEDAGVRVLSCGTCLDYFHLKDSLKVGQVTNMQDTVTALMTADWVIRP